LSGRYVLPCGEQGLGLARYTNSARTNPSACTAAISAAPSLEASPIAPLPLIAADTLAWFRTLPSERQTKLRAGLAPERESELLAKLKA
jgi:hypothetical protein